MREYITGRFIVIFSLIFFMIAFTGCASYKPHPLKLKPVPEMHGSNAKCKCSFNETKKYLYKYDGLSKEVPKILPYAIASATAYPNNEQIHPYGYLPNIVRYEGRKSGFSADVYYKKNKEGILIAYRGTDPKALTPIVKDLLASINPFSKWAGQYKSAYKLYKKIIDDNDGVEDVVLTGHSLGGGLAMHVALRVPGTKYDRKAKVVVFNPSPIVKQKFDENK